MSGPHLRRPSPHADLITGARFLLAVAALVLLQLVVGRIVP